MIGGGGGSNEEPEAPRKPTGLIGRPLLNKVERGIARPYIGLGGTIEDDDPRVFKASCTIKRKFIKDASINPNSPMNAISLSLYNEAFAQQLIYEGSNIIGTIEKAPIVIGRFFFYIELTVYNDMSTIINLSLTSLVLGKPFVKTTGVTLNEDDNSALFTNGVRKVIFRDGSEEVYEYQRHVGAAR